MARTATHGPGDNSIDDVEVKSDKGTGGYMITWRWWPYDGSPPKVLRHKGSTKGETLGKARAKLAELQSDTSGAGRWSKSSNTGDYIEQVVRPAITNSSRLADGSKELYLRSITLIDGQIGTYPIARTIEFRTAEKCLTTIAAVHGAQSAKTARNVLNRWVFGQMKRDKLITQSPLADMDVDLGTKKTTTKPSNDTALGAKDYDRLLDHLLGIDVSTVELPARSRDSARARLRTTIDVTLLQMVTGIRLGSARTIEPHELVDNAAGGVNVFIPAAKLKGRRHALTVPVLDTRVAERMQALRTGTPAGSYVFGSPADRTAVWDRRNATRSIEALYVSLADELGIEELRASIRSHGWRTTLNTLYHHLPAHDRAAWFGHTEAVNQRHYNDPTADPTTSQSIMLDAAGRRGLRAV